MLDLSLQQKVLQSQISDMSYKLTNGKKLSNKNFYEGIINPGTIDIASAPESKITKEMILDYRQKEDERTYKNAAGEDVKFQNTNLPGEILEYKPKFEGDDVDLEGATRDLKDMIKLLNRKKQAVINSNLELDLLYMDKHDLTEELKQTPVWNLTGRTQRVIAQEMQAKDREIRAKEREFQQIYTEHLELQNEVQTQVERIPVLQANIEENEREKAIIDKKNKETAKEYGEKFNLLNWQQQQVGQQPNESDAAYIKRLKDLENLKVDPTLYKQKAINENINKLKANLKQIVKDTGKIDQLVSYFRDDDEAYILNSYWDQISVYLKKYGFDVNNNDLNFLKLKDELKSAIQNIKNQPFNVTIKSEKNNVGNTSTINNAIQVQKISDDVLELINYEDTTKLYIKVIDKGNIQYSKDNTDYKTFDFQVKKEKIENPLVPKKTSHFFFDVIKNFNKNLLPNTSDYKKIFGDTKIKSDIYAHLKKTLKDKVVGSGMKKGSGMSQTETIKDDIPKVINFGRNKLLLNKLYYNNILSVKDSKMHSIENMPNKHVSDNFVKIIYNIYNNKLDSNAAIKLNSSELELLDLLLFVSGLSKKFNIDTKRDDNIKKLKERLTLVESQIKAGNNNPVVKEELKQIIKKLYLFKAISLNSAKDYIKQFK
jgi:hypothetical protein